uniref:Uncharacterized protein n=1 Tax=Haptolina ericina TaxID=156174 RepID=A0A7S3AD07_9EUKA|mmetsp:Transcript_11349/g.26086  ORF Transcript_11349/g.26086 Transcript_11349/m.26086 type:complete len:244 (+) Transcript_11349:82-813(+)
MLSVMFLTVFIAESDPTASKLKIGDHVLVHPPSMPIQEGTITGGLDEFNTFEVMLDAEPSFVQRADARHVSRFEFVDHRVTSGLAVPGDSDYDHLDADTRAAVDLQEQELVVAVQSAHALGVFSAKASRLQVEAANLQTAVERAWRRGTMTRVLHPPLGLIPPSAESADLTLRTDTLDGVQGYLYLGFYLDGGGLVQMQSTYRREMGVNETVWAQPTPDAEATQPSPTHSHRRRLSRAPKSEL